VTGSLLGRAESMRKSRRPSRSERVDPGEFVADGVLFFTPPRIAG